MNPADLLSLARVALTLPLVLAILAGAPLAAGLLLFAALATDFLDGHVARRQGGGTARGRILDPLADKVLAAGALCALLAVGRAPAELVLVVVLRDLALLLLGWLRLRDGAPVPAANRAGKVAFTALGTWIAGTVVGVPWPPFAAAAVGILYAVAGFSYAARLPAPVSRAAEGKR